MANVSTQVKETVYKIARWKGVNEAQEGEASLEMGEAAVMRNFRVTAGGALKKRGGSQNVAGLLSGGYTVAVDGDNEQTLFTETGASTLSLTLYPGVSVNDMGALSLTGTPVTVTEANADNYEGYYYKHSNGNIYQFSGIVRSRS